MIRQTLNTWICTKRRELNLFHKPTGNFIHLTTQTACNNVVYGIMDDEKGNIWEAPTMVFLHFLANGDKLKKLGHPTLYPGRRLAINEFNTNAFAKLSQW